MTTDTNAIVERLEKRMARISDQGRFTLIDKFDLRALLAERAEMKRLLADVIAYREGHPAMCCGQCNDTLDRLLGLLREVHQNMHVPIKLWHRIDAAIREIGGEEVSGG